MFYPPRFIERVKSVLVSIKMSEEDRDRVLSLLEKHDESLGKFLADLAKSRFSGKEIVELLNTQKLDVLYRRAKRYAEYEDLWQEWQTLKLSQEKTIIPHLFIEKSAEEKPSGAKE